MDWLLEGVWADSLWKEGEIEIEIEIATAIGIERA